MNDTTTLRELGELTSKATRAALDVLDERFPGKNNGGIDDKLAFAVDAVIQKHLLRIVKDRAFTTLIKEWRR